MDSEVIIFGAASLFAGIMALAVIQFYGIPANDATTAEPPFYDIVQRAPLQADRIQR